MALGLTSNFSSKFWSTTAMTFVRNSSGKGLKALYLIGSVFFFDIADIVIDFAEPFPQSRVEFIFDAAIILAWHHPCNDRPFVS